MHFGLRPSPAIPALFQRQPFQRRYFLLYLPIIRDAGRELSTPMTLEHVSARCNANTALIAESVEALHHSARIAQRRQRKFSHVDRETLSGLLASRPS